MTTENLMDGILKERDHLQEIKNACGSDWDRPEFFFYRAAWDQLMKRATEAIGGRMDAVEMLVLYSELQEFEA